MDFSPAQFIEHGFELGSLTQFQDDPNYFGGLAEDIKLAITAIQKEVDYFLMITAASLSEAVDTGSFEPGKRYLGTCLPVVADVFYTKEDDLRLRLRDRRHYSSIQFCLNHLGETTIEEIEGLPFWITSLLITSYTAWFDMKFVERPN